MPTPNRCDGGGGCGDDGLRHPGEEDSIPGAGVQILEGEDSTPEAGVHSLEGEDSILEAAHIHKTGIPAFHRALHQSSCTAQSTHFPAGPFAARTGIQSRRRISVQPAREPDVPPSSWPCACR